MTAQEKLDVLNSMSIDDYSVGCGDCEYVMTKDTPEKVEALFEMGMTEEMFADSVSQINGWLELSSFAFQVVGAECWSKTDGFTLG
ncbi:hypothetical protein [Alteribacter populi]|uniref:hypothetical protein n=1 Tax=Alteribacter populi TaxID=2011011 RepID=UPI000BBB25DB|nr:hypothetical protein [Alteribacter populi]